MLHRRFADFTAFLVEFVLDRTARIGDQDTALRVRAGQGTVAGNLAAALPDLFSPAALALIRLVIARDELRVRPRATTGPTAPPSPPPSRGSSPRSWPVPGNPDEERRGQHDANPRPRLIRQAGTP